MEILAISSTSNFAARPVPDANCCRSTGVFKPIFHRRRQGTVAYRGRDAILADLVIDDGPVGAGRWPVPAVPGGPETAIGKVTGLLPGQRLDQYIRKTLPHRN